jgi:hypothetical protein
MILEQSCITLQVLDTKVSQRREAEDAGLGHFGIPKGLTPTPLDIIIIIYHHITMCNIRNITHWVKRMKNIHFEHKNVLLSGSIQRLNGIFRDREEQCMVLIKIN